MQSIKQYRNLSRPLLVAAGLLSVAGLVDSLFLTVTHYTNALVLCSLTHGCETVLRSSYSEFFGIPIAVFGIIFYLGVLATSIFFVQNKEYHVWFSLWGVIGFMSTLYLLFIQAIILHAFCQYCLLSAATSTLIFTTTSVLYFIHNNKGEYNDQKKS